LASGIARPTRIGAARPELGPATVGTPLVVRVGRRHVGVLMALVCLALAAVACQPGPAGPTAELGTVRVVSTALPATPTVPATPGGLTYVPVVIQGIPVEPTPVATRRPGDPTPKVKSDSVVVTEALTAQRNTADGPVLEVEGEVTNTGPYPVQGVRVVVEGRNASGSCGRGALTLLGKPEEVLVPGESWPFSGTVGLSCSVQTVNVDTMALQSGALPLRLDLEEVSVGVSAGGGWQLQGTVRNSTSGLVTYPRVVATVRRSDGSYLASGLAYAAASRLPVGGTAPFSITIPMERVTGWAGYSAIATGERG